MATWQDKSTGRIRETRGNASPGESWIRISGVLEDWCGNEPGEPAEAVEADPQAGLDISVCEQGYKGFAGVYLVRGCGKRTVRVILRPFYGACDRRDDYDLVAQAARFAAKRGWRKVVVAPEELYGEEPRVFNLDQYFALNARYGYQGASLDFVGSKRNGQGR